MILQAGPHAGEGPLVGRVRELAELQAAFEAAARGHGGVQLVLGDPGIGKTRLAAELAEHAAAEGARVVWTRAWEGVAPSYRPWIEAVRGLASGPHGAHLRGELGDATLRRLARLVPELADGAPVAAEDDELTRFALFDALGSLLRAAAAQAPLVLVIDDLHAVDEASLVALDFVSRTLGDAAVLIVATLHERVPRRTAEAQTALQNVVRGGRRIFLGGLARAEVGELFELLSGAPPTPALLDALHAATEGNPFFAREIVALLLSRGRAAGASGELSLPATVLEAIRRRLDPLDAEARETLALAAVFGRAFSLVALQRASPLDSELVARAVEGAVALGLVVELPAAVEQYRFAHGLIPAALLAALPAAKRMELHRAVADALEDILRGDIEGNLALLAHHFLAAGPGVDARRAVDYAERAARQALEGLAPEHAAELFARALEALERLPPDPHRRARLLLGLGIAQAGACRPAARATLEAAIAAARAVGAAELFAQAALGLGPFALTPGYVDDAHVALLGEALERIGPGDDSLRVRLLGSLAVALYWSDARQRRARLADEALALARRLGDEHTLAFALSSAQLATAGPDMTEQGLRWLAELFELTERIGESAASLAARSRHVDLLLELGDIAGADIAVQTLERLAGQARDRRAAAFVPAHRARRAMLDGRFDEARRLLAALEPVAAELPATTIPLTVASLQVVLTWAQRGPREILEPVRGYAARIPAMACWRAALAAALADAGRVDEARLELDRLVDGGCAALPRDNLWLGAMALLTEAVAAVGLPDHADAVAAQLAPFAARSVVLPTVAFLGPAELWLGILASVAERDSEALERLAVARERATGDGARTIVARIDVEEAVVLVRDGGEAAARRAARLLEGALAACEAIGLPWLAERAQELLGRLEVRAAGPAAAPVGAARERDAVARLRRGADAWTIDWRGATIHLRDLRGLRLLALLLERPGVELHSLELVAAVDGGRGGGRDRGGPGGGAGANAGDGTQARLGAQGDAGPALDARAKAEYRARIERLRSDLAGARARRDASEAEAIGAELEFLSGELSRATGLHGRDRPRGSHAERARVNVTRAIHSALQRIARHDPELGAELARTVRTGTFCRYCPDPRRPLRWIVER